MKNIAHSNREKLKNKAFNEKIELHMLIQRFLMERFLYRLSISEYCHKFILNGASLFLVWKGVNFRVTKDADLLGFGSPDIETLKSIFIEICKVKPENDDGIIYHHDSIEITRLKEEQQYKGARIIIPANLTEAVMKIQIDIGFGDAVVPGPETINYPSLLKYPNPKLRAYSKYTFIAEKAHAMITLGLTNSRMKDLHDICLASRLFKFELSVLCSSMLATFTRRKTDMPNHRPVIFTADFYSDTKKNIQWNSFLKKNRPVQEFGTLEETVNEIFIFLEKPLNQFNAAIGCTDLVWTPVKGWHSPKEEK